MALLFTVFSIVAIGVAIILGASFIGRILILLYKEVRRHRIKHEQRIIEERKTHDLLVRLVAEKYGAARERPSEQASDGPEPTPEPDEKPKT
jgi:hypothetical protein